MRIGVVRREPKIVSKQVTVADLIQQCNLVVANMQNEHTGTAHNRRLLILNCAMAMRQLSDTLAARDAEIQQLRSKLGINQETNNANNPDMESNGYTRGADGDPAILPVDEPGPKH